MDDKAFNTALSFHEEVIITDSVAKLGVTRSELWRIDGIGLCRMDGTVDWSID
jgi:hypothetical protein